MLQGWGNQQRARFLKERTIVPRVRLVRRFAEFSDLYPWQWTPAEGESWIASLRSGSSPLAISTLRGYEVTIRVFCEFLTDRRYRWADECQSQFGATPEQIFHDDNSIIHVAEYEGRGSRRPLTYDEVQALFDAADGLADQIAARHRKAVLPALRDAAMIKFAYAFGLRRNEIAMCDVVGADASARERIRSANRLLTHLTVTGRSISDLDQATFDRWCNGNIRRTRVLAGFIKWLTARHLVTDVTVPTIPKAPIQHLGEEDEQRELIRSLLDDTNELELDLRVAGLLILLYGARIPQITALTTDHVHVDENRVAVTLPQAQRLNIPPAMAPLVAELVANARTEQGRIREPAPTTTCTPVDVAANPSTQQPSGSSSKPLGSPQESTETRPCSPLPKTSPLPSSPHTSASPSAQRPVGAEYRNATKPTTLSPVCQTKTDQPRSLRDWQRHADGRRQSRPSPSE